jgi:hypothetical protein
MGTQMVASFTQLFADIPAPDLTVVSFTADVYQGLSFSPLFFSSDIHLQL